MRQMSEAHFAILRRHMVEVIAIHVELASEELGKAALDARVLAAMAGVPAPPLRAGAAGVRWPTTTRRCRSASTRRSRSRSSSR